MGSRKDTERAADQPAMVWSSQASATASTTSATSKAPTARWLRILQEVMDGAIAHLDLQSVLQELLGRVREGMQVDNTAILLTSTEGTYLTVYAARGPEEDVTGSAQVRFGRG